MSSLWIAWLLSQPYLLFAWIKDAARRVRAFADKLSGRKVS